MTSWQQESLRMRVVPTCTSIFPCIFSAQCQQVQAKDADGPPCAAGPIGTQPA